MSRIDVITVREASKSYGPVVAVDGISFSVTAGEIFGLLGPNGAGKTTTLDCLTGLKRVDRGDVRVFGLDAWADRRAIRSRIGVQLQESRLQARVKVWEALDVFASFYPDPMIWEQLLEPLGLVEKRNALFGDLSGGQKQRLFVALAMVGDGELLFLDELTTGLDPQARRAMWAMVRHVRERGKTIVLTTHFMEEAERLCDRVAILDRGRLMAVNDPETLIRRNGDDVIVRFVVEADFDRERVERVEGVTRVESMDGRVRVRGQGDRVIPGVTAALAEMGCRFRDFRSERVTLEDVFLALTGRTGKQ